MTLSVERFALRRNTSKLVAVMGIALAVGTAGSAGAAAPTDLSQGGSLSQKLDRSKGVIHPKGDVDPGITRTTPDPKPHSMIVIPPSKLNGGKEAK